MTFDEVLGQVRELLQMTRSVPSSGLNSSSLEGQFLDHRLEAPGRPLLLTSLQSLAYGCQQS